MAVEVKEKHRITITLPLEVVKDLRELVPRGERNRFIVGAMQKELLRAKLLHALEVSFGAWSDEDYPALKTDEDIDHFIRGLRESWMPRTWDEIESEGANNE